ncbi:MAG TPA: hypothetical protein VHD32_04990 [Candidatus Didemnitutus sp.]|nr:hypothetical protein [Candidatus Didemnitutus sp.]
MNRTFAPLALVVVSFILLAGCASDKAKAEALDRKNHPENYVLITPLGSNVPVWVRKEKVTKSQGSQADQDALLEAQRRNLAASSANVPGDPASQPQHSGAK